MESIFTYNDYRKYINSYLRSMPKKGFGQSRRLAGYLNVHTTLVSQVLKGLKDFTFEQAAMVAEFLALNDLESEYFILLVQYSRAGNESLRKILQRQILGLQKKSSDLSNRLSSERTLTEEERAVFYSDWSYAAVRQLTAIKDLQNIDAISSYLKLSRKKTRDVLEFLVKTNLCHEENGKFKIAVKSTHLSSESPWVRVHHINWRQRAIEAMSESEAKHLHYTCPLTLAKSDAIKVREQIIRLLESVDKIIEPSNSEELHCLNIDWFQVKSV